jgi:hypothetical protein
MPAGFSKLSWGRLAALIMASLRAAALHAITTTNTAPSKNLRVPALKGDGLPVGQANVTADQRRESRVASVRALPTTVVGVPVELESGTSSGLARD